jgi:chromosome segregation and condensation protein ScpB
MSEEKIKSEAELGAEKEPLTIEQLEEVVGGAAGHIEPGSNPRS